MLVAVCQNHCKRGQRNEAHLQYMKSSQRIPFCLSLSPPILTWKVCVFPQIIVRGHISLCSRSFFFHLLAIQQWCSSEFWPRMTMGAQLIQQGQTIFSTVVMSWFNFWNGVIMPQSHAPKNEKNKIMLQESYPFQLRANDSISLFFSSTVYNLSVAGNCRRLPLVQYDETFKHRSRTRKDIYLSSKDKTVVTWRSG